MNNTPNWKRAVALSLALLVLVPQVATQTKSGGVISTISASAYETYGDFKYTVSDKNATITGYSGAGGEVTIPDIVRNDTTSYTVTAIGSYAFF